MSKAPSRHSAKRIRSLSILSRYAAAVSFVLAGVILIAVYPTGFFWWGLPPFLSPVGVVLIFGIVGLVSAAPLAGIAGAFHAWDGGTSPVVMRWIVFLCLVCWVGLGVYAASVASGGAFGFEYHPAIFAAAMIGGIGICCGIAAGLLRVTRLHRMLRALVILAMVFAVSAFLPLIGALVSDVSLDDSGRVAMTPTRSASMAIAIAFVVLMLRPEKFPEHSRRQQRKRRSTAAAAALQCPRCEHVTPYEPGESRCTGCGLTIACEVLR